jgi:hypothetical protein
MQSKGQALVDVSYCENISVQKKLFRRNSASSAPQAASNAQTTTTELLGSIGKENCEFLQAMVAYTQGTENKDMQAIAAWQALAGAITDVVIGDDGLPNRLKANNLARQFQAIDKYCDDVLYGEEQNDGEEKTKERADDLGSIRQLPAAPLAPALLPHHPVRQVPVHRPHPVRRARVPKLRQINGVLMFHKT